MTTIAVTKQGNFYNKANAGKVVLGAAGAVGGAFGGKFILEDLRATCEEKIKNAPKDVLKELGKILNSDTVDLSSRAKDIKEAKETIAWINKYDKMVFAGCAIGLGILGLILGGIPDKITSSIRAKKADKIAAQAQAEANQEIQ